MAQVKVLFRYCLGLIEPNSGQIIVDNKLVNLNSLLEKKINYASQNSILLNSNLKDNVILNEFDKQKYLSLQTSWTSKLS